MGESHACASGGSHNGDCRDFCLLEFRRLMHFFAQVYWDQTVYKSCVSAFVLGKCVCVV